MNAIFDTNVILDDITTNDKEFLTLDLTVAPISPSDLLFMLGSCKIIHIFTILRRCLYNKALRVV